MLKQIIYFESQNVKTSTKATMVEFKDFWFEMEQSSKYLMQSRIMYDHCMNQIYNVSYAKNESSQLFKARLLNFIQNDLCIHTYMCICV